MLHTLHHGNILSCAKISLLIAIRCCILIINCSKVIYHRVQHFSVDSHTLLYANRILQEINLLLCDYISLLQAICCHMRTIYCSKLIRLSCTSILLLQTSCCYLLLFLCFSFACKSCAAAKLSLIECLYVSAARHTLFMQILYYSKVIFYCVLIFSCCKPYSVC